MNNTKQRKKCDCMASVHSLINNCLACGRIVCEVEGEGPCSFCANPVYKPENLDEFEEQMNLMKDLENDPDIMQSYIKAVENKNKLIRYDKTDIARKNMIDEDTDWYEIKNDVWQSNEVRKHALNKMIDLEEEEDYAAKNETMTFDLETGKMQAHTIKVDYKKHKNAAAEFLSEVEREQREVEEFEVDERLKSAQKEILENIKNSFKTPKIKEEDLKDKRVPMLTTKIKHDDCYEDFKNAIMKAQSKKAITNELPEECYDKELYKAHPSNLACLSMWQPWASLVIYGFKRFEGRQWDSDYRGPLWIHAGSRQPTPEEIEAVEKQYKLLYQGVSKKDLPEFPNEYPTGCLIGLVDLQSVIDQKTYKQHVPKEYTKESTSEFLFVARNPRRLMVPIRMPGKRGIFNIEPEICRTGLMGLKKVPTNWFPYFADNLPEEVKQIEEGKKEAENTPFKLQEEKQKIFEELQLESNLFLILKI